LFWLFRLDLGTASGDSVEEEGPAGVGVDADAAPGPAEGSLRRELKEEMKSTARGESPRRLLKWETASGLERVAA
jgi:hypothetical protein